MKKIILLISITIFGWIGWWLGDHIGIMTAYLVSFVGSLFGVYVGVRINQDYLNWWRSQQWIRYTFDFNAITSAHNLKIWLYNSIVNIAKSNIIKSHFSQALPCYCIYRWFESLFPRVNIPPENHASPKTNRQKRGWQEMVENRAVETNFILRKYVQTPSLPWV